MTLSIAPDKFTQPDFTVFYTAPDGRKLVVGRIFKATAAPQETPWFWSVDFHQRDNRVAPHQGHCEDLETAKAAWKRCWESAAVPFKLPPSLQQ
jgi:hypothetical protein